MSNYHDRKKRVLVVGGGIAGLAFGVQLLTHAYKFYDVIVFEKVGLGIFPPCVISVWQI